MARWKDVGYRYLNHEWGPASDRAALLFEVHEHIAGFPLVRLGPPHQIAEFLLLPKYSRRGVGANAARQVRTSACWIRSSLGCQTQVDSVYRDRTVPPMQLWWAS